MALPGDAASDKPTVFISYSRRDALVFADQLDAALRACGFATTVDRHGISAGEDWRRRLGDLILSADTVVFVLTPESAASEICLWEIEEAARLSKRILPVIAMPLGTAGAPEALASLNYIHFHPEPADPGAGFGTGLAKLKAALEDDLDWLREHTRLQAIATAWAQRGRPNNRLLTAEGIREAREWLAHHPRTAPEPTSLQLELIVASEAQETAQQSERQRELEERERLVKAAEVAQNEREAALARADRSFREAQIAARTRLYTQYVALGLMATTIAGLVAWINEQAIARFANWHLVMRPYRDANFTPYALTDRRLSETADGTTFRDCARTCPHMTLIPRGAFMMGSPQGEERRSDDEGPRHEVTIGTRFAMSTYPVTVAEWHDCVRVGGCPVLPDDGFSGDDRPVVNVSWDEALHYARWLSMMTGGAYRLPSEAEWEYAARGGRDTKFAWGDEVGTNNANCIGCGSRWDNKSTSPVGSFKPNGFGLYDLQGNIWQWTLDCYRDSYVGAPADGTAREIECPQARRVVRGGGWDSYTYNIRTANRDRISTGNRLNDLGFRLVRSF